MSSYHTFSKCALVFYRSICETKMETELFSLRKSNAELVAALHEANSNIEQWKNQLAEYQQETHRLRDQASCFLLLDFVHGRLFMAMYLWRAAHQTWLLFSIKVC